MNIRFATKDDIDLIVKLRTLQLIDEESQFNGDEKSSDEYIAHLKRYLNTMFDRQHFIQVFLEENNEVCATGAMMWVEYPPSFSNNTGYMGYITNMYTKPQYRKKGYATQVLSILKEEAQKQGLTRLFLGASLEGQPVYKKFGFTEVDWYKLDI